jgi:hypothetical protein
MELAYKINYVLGAPAQDFLKEDHFQKRLYDLYELTVVNHHLFPYVKQAMKEFAELEWHSWRDRR